LLQTSIILNYISQLPRIDSFFALTSVTRKLAEPHACFLFSSPILLADDVILDTVPIVSLDGFANVTHAGNVQVFLAKVLFRAALLIRFLPQLYDCLNLASLGGLAKLTTLDNFGVSSLPAFL
jgi:hypothetical protein